LIVAQDSSTLCPCRKALSTVLTAILFFLPASFYADISFKHCGIRMNFDAGPSGLAVISLQEEDSLLVLASLGGAKEVSAMECWRDLDRNSFESKDQ
jgi:hypothetical protein